MHRMLMLVLGVLLGLAGCDDSDPRVDGRVRGSATLMNFESCAELEMHLKDSWKERSQSMLERYLDDDFWYYGGGVAADGRNQAAAPTAGAAEGGRTEGVDFTGTNNQEAGADEGDFVKTDGYHFYALSGNELTIMEVEDFGDLEWVSATEVEGYPFEMFIAGDRVLVVSRVSPEELVATSPDSTATSSLYYYQPAYKVSVFDATDGTEPSLENEYYFTSWYQTGRYLRDLQRLILASYEWFDIPGLIYYPQINRWGGVSTSPPSSGGSSSGAASPPSRSAAWAHGADALWHKALKEAVEDAIAHNNAIINALSIDEMLPSIWERVEGTLVRLDPTIENCTNYSVAETSYGTGFTSLISLGLGENVDVSVDTVATNYATLYASADTVIIATASNEEWWYYGAEEYNEATDIHRFSITSGDTQYTGSGRVDGLVQDSFSISEYNDAIRVATTEGRFWWWMPEGEPPTNHVHVLAGEGELAIVGSVRDIAEGERIWSARFVEDKGYVVTFQNIDPLWTFDLSDPTDPKLLGELEVPGVSTYVHPLENELLTIGIPGDSNGLHWGEVQLSLFDVSDMTDPSLDSSLVYGPPAGEGWYSAYSEATYEHKAFQYFAPVDLVAIPLHTYRCQSVCEYSARLELTTVHGAGGLEPYGTIDHSSFFTEENWWVLHGIRRTFFMGEDHVYAVSDRGMTAHLLSDLSVTASAELPGTTYGDYYGWGPEGSTTAGGVR